MSEFESSSPTKRVVAVLRPVRTASRSELWKSSLGNMVTLGARRVGSPLRQTLGLCSSKLLREVPRTRLCARRGSAATDDRAQTWFYVRLTLAAACSRRKLHSISLHHRASRLVHDATECPWELYRWLSNGLTLCYDLLRREP